MTDDPSRPTATSGEPEVEETPFHDEPMGDDFDPDAISGAFNVRSLLQQTEEVPPPKRDVLQGVQQRIRTRSRGRFFGDGWSTREDNPRTTYLLTALMMLILVGVTYFALLPGGLTGP